jgi:hypothetical protein
LAHDPEKACPGRDRGLKPVFGKDHAQSKNASKPVEKQTAPTKAGAALNPQPS